MSARPAHSSWRLSLRPGHTDDEKMMAGRHADAKVTFFRGQLGGEAYQLLQHMGRGACTWPRLRPACAGIAPFHFTPSIHATAQCRHRHRRAQTLCAHPQNRP